MITKEQAEKIKEHLLTQLDNFPEDKKEIIKKQIMSMSQEDIENFIRQNQLNHLKENTCIFCEIIKQKIPCYKIDENKENIAVLEINPLTKAHTLIISKNHSELKDSAEKLAKQVSKEISKKLKPKKIKLEKKEIMEHKLIEIILFYLLFFFLFLLIHCKLELFQLICAP
jgi:Fe2+ transport system protein B